MRRLHPDRHKSTAPEEAITRLQSGNDRFTAGKSIDRDPMAQVKQAAINPFATIVGCIDSRVPPELAFDQRGSLFTRSVTSINTAAWPRWAIAESAKAAAQLARQRPRWPMPRQQLRRALPFAIWSRNADDPSGAERARKRDRHDDLQPGLHRRSSRGGSKVCAAAASWSGEIPV
jgi:hypothetical protein